MTATGMVRNGAGEYSLLRSSDLPSVATPVTIRFGANGTLSRPWPAMEDRDLVVLVSSCETVIRVTTGPLNGVTSLQG